MAATRLPVGQLARNMRLTRRSCSTACNSLLCKKAKNLDFPKATQQAPSRLFRGAANLAFIGNKGDETLPHQNMRKMGVSVEDLPSFETAAMEVLKDMQEGDDKPMFIWAHLEDGQKIHASGYEKDGKAMLKFERKQDSEFPIPEAHDEASLNVSIKYIKHYDDLGRGLSMDDIPQDKTFKEYRERIAKENKDSWVREPDE